MTLTRQNCLLILPLKPIQYLNSDVSGSSCRTVMRCCDQLMLSGTNHRTLCPKTHRPTHILTSCMNHYILEYTLSPCGSPDNWRPFSRATARDREKEKKNILFDLYHADSDTSSITSQQNQLFNQVDVDQPMNISR